MSQPLEAGGHLWTVRIERALMQLFSEPRPVRGRVVGPRPVLQVLKWAADRTVRATNVIDGLLSVADGYTIHDTPSDLLTALGIQYRSPGSGPA